MNTSTQNKTQSFRNSPSKLDSLGRDTVFAGDLINDFIAPKPHQKKRDLQGIQNVWGSSLHVLESRPQKESYKQKPLIGIVRNTYETKNGTKIKQRCTSPILSFLTESATFHEEKSEINRFKKVFKEKIGFEAGRVPLKGDGFSKDKKEKVERNYSGGMKESLRSGEEEIVRKNGGEVKELMKATRENVGNNLKSPSKFKYSLNNKQVFYAN